MHRIEAGAVHEQRASEMGDGAHSARSVVDLARLRIGHEFGNRLGWDRGVDAENEGAGPEDADRDEIFLRIVVHLLQLRHDGDLRSGGEEQRVAVGRGLSNVGGSKCAARPDSVLDDKTLLEILGQLLARHACHYVSVAAGGVADNHRHRLGGPIRRPCGGHCEHQHRRNDEGRPPDDPHASKQLTCGRPHGCGGCSH